MFHHALNLLHTAWRLLLTSLSTSTLSFWMFTVILPILIFGALILSRWLSGPHTSVKFWEILKHSLARVLLTVAVTVTVWLVLFFVFTGLALYNDHENLVARLGFTLNERS